MIGRHGILPRTLPTPAPWRAARFRHPRRPLPDPCRSTVPLRFPPRARSIKVDLPLNQISYLSPHRYQVPVVSRGTASARRSTSCCGRPRSIGRPKFCAGVRLSLLRYFTTFIEVIWEEVVSSTLQMENLGRAKMLACRPGTIQRSESEEFPLLVAKTSLTQDGVNHRNRNVARVHRDRSSPPVGMHIPGMAAALPPQHKPRSFQLADEVAGPKRSKRHGRGDSRGERILPAPRDPREAASPPLGACRSNRDDCEERGHAVRCRAPVATRSGRGNRGGR